MQSNSELFIEERDMPLKSFEKGFTKSDIKILASNAIDRLLEKGEPLKIAESISAAENFIKEVKEDPRYKDYVREEASKYPKGFISESGAKIELAETGTTYDFTNCNDSLFESLQDDSNKIKMLLDERKDFLKKIPTSGLEVLNTNTGELEKIYPPSKSSTSSYKITLAK